MGRGGCRGGGKGGERWGCVGKEAEGGGDEWRGEDDVVKEVGGGGNTMCGGSFRMRDEQS